jgi:RNA polymerase sigma factor (sigma-70 family)
LLQETWLRAWVYRKTFRGDGPAAADCSFGAWLARVCRTIESSALSRASRERDFLSSFHAYDLEQTAAPPTGEANEFDAQASLELLLSFIAELPPRQRAVVELRCVRSMSTDLTASSLGCMPGTVKATLNAARRTLRARMNSVRSAGD